uniref:Uncharacterized protein n=1 Tax=Glossina brevipalpis TaxID=37001 RepID=A0A1A9X1Z4_9MUSC
MALFGLLENLANGRLFHNSLQRKKERNTLHPPYRTKYGISPCVSSKLIWMIVLYLVFSFLHNHNSTTNRNTTQQALLLKNFVSPLNYFLIWITWNKLFPSFNCRHVSPRKRASEIRFETIEQYYGETI